MAVSSINSLTKLRLTGLSSGLDTDTIIKSMMQIEQLKINRQYRSRTTLQWRQEALTGIKTDLSTFKNDFISVAGKNTLMATNAFNTFKVESTGKNASAVTLSTTTNAKVGSVTIDAIYSLAKGAEATSTKTAKTSLRPSGLYNYEGLPEGDMGPNSDMTLEELNKYLKSPLEFATETVTDPDTGVVSTNKYIAFSINGTQFKFNSDITLRQMTEAITNSTAGVNARTDWTKDGLIFESKLPNENIVIDNIAGSAFAPTNDKGSAFGLYSGTYLSNTVGVSNGTSLSTSGKNAADTMLKDLSLAQKLVFQDGVIAFSINGKRFEFKDTDTLGHMMSTISSDPDANAEMSYSELTDTFTVKSKTKGLGSFLSIQNHVGNAFDGGSRSAFGIGPGTFYNGSQAIMKINGTIVRRDSNDFTIDGITYSLNKTMEEGEEPIEATVSRDVQPAIDKIKEFVTGYNTIITKLQSMLVERKSNDEKSYVPLTEDEKAEMTEKQIEEWDKIAKKGILKSDAGIQSLLSRLRGALYESVSSVGLTPADIGLQTGDYRNGGVIELDDGKLKAALEKNPNAVMRLFTDYVDNEEDRSVEYKKSGLMMRIGMILDDYTKGANEIALDGIESSLKQVSSKITEMLEKMAVKEEKLYAQYAAMETALSKIQSQSDWLTSMLGSTGSK